MYDISKRLGAQNQLKRVYCISLTSHVNTFTRSMSNSHFQKNDDKLQGHIILFFINIHVNVQRR